MHAPPAEGFAAHAPHVWLAAVLQKALLHCDASKHGVPFESCPGIVRQALGKSFPVTPSHDAPGSACAQASMLDGVLEVPLAASFVTQASCARVVQVATSP
jgi:hypothetical protein